MLSPFRDIRRVRAGGPRAIDSRAFRADGASVSRTGGHQDEHPGNHLRRAQHSRKSGCTRHPGPSRGHTRTGRAAVRKGDTVRRCHHRCAQGRQVLCSRGPLSAPGQACLHAGRFPGEPPSGQHRTALARGCLAPARAPTPQHRRPGCQSLAGEPRSAFRTRCAGLYRLHVWLHWTAEGRDGDAPCLSAWRTGSNERLPHRHRRSLAHARYEVGSALSRLAERRVRLSAGCQQGGAVTTRYVSAPGRHHALPFRSVAVQAFRRYLDR